MALSQNGLSQNGLQQAGSVRSLYGARKQSFIDQFDYGFVVCYNAQLRFKSFAVERLILWYAVNASKCVTSCVHEFASALIARALRCLQCYTSTATFHELDRDVRSMPKSVSNDSICRYSIAVKNDSKLSQNPRFSDTCKTSEEAKNTT